MLSTDRTEFEAQVGTLCAAFNVPATRERQDAFWTGMAKMSLIEFVRGVEFAVGEEGPEKFPTTKAFWKLHREIKAKARGYTQQAVKQVEQQEHLLYFANRLFFRHMMNRGGLGSTGTFVPARGMVDCKASDELLAARQVLRDHVAWFCGPVRDGDPDATPHEFVTQLIPLLERVSPIDQRTLDGWTAMIEHPSAKVPFAPYMGRELPVEQPELTDAR
jgi:hypothetical protein